MRLINLSARSSDLARLQAYRVGEALQKAHADIKIKYLFRESLGDKNLQDPLWKMPEKGVFTEDFYQDLLQEKTDMVVHSWKDLPTEGKPDTSVVATLPRADQRDILLLKKTSIGRSRLKIYSSSPRRIYNLQPLLPTMLPWPGVQVEFANVRGNIPTRVKKLMGWLPAQAAGETPDGLILAKAAMDRLLSSPEPEFAECREVLNRALDEVEFMIMPLSINPTAAAQGALAVEIKSSRKDVLALLDAINDQVTFKAVGQERTRLSELGGGCHQKIGISVFPLKNGNAYFERGLTDKGEVLQVRTMQLTKAAPKFAAGDLWSLKNQGAVRDTLPITPAQLQQIQNSHLWISRKNALPEHVPLKETLVWCAGLTTWQSLAARGYWVHGCADGLGETYSMGLDVFLNRYPKRPWVKLTHDGAEGLIPNQTMPSLATYSLSTNEVDWQIQPHHQFFFWASGSQFEAALTKFPMLRERTHACGLGHTESVLQKHIPAKNIYTYLSEQDWRTQCQA